MERCSLYGKEIIDSQHGGGTSTTTTPTIRVGMSWWIVLWLTPGDAPVSSLWQWTTLIFIYFLRFFFGMFSYFFSQIFRAWLYEGEHSCQTLRFYTFGRLELLTFKDPFSPADYKACEKIKKNRRTSHNLTTDVFVKFLDKVWFAFCLVLFSICIPFCNSMPFVFLTRSFFAKRHFGSS